MREAEEIDESDESKSRMSECTSEADLIPLTDESTNPSHSYSVKEVKTSLYTLYLTSLMGAIGYSSIMTSAYSYLLSLNPNASTRLYGWIIAFYSVGQFVASPILGYLSQKLPCRPLFAVTILLMAFGNLLYSYLSLFSQEYSGAMMLIARLILGVGAGNATLIRIYASAVTTTEERPVAMAWVTGTQALGFIIGPVIQTAFEPLGDGVAFDRIRLHFDMYTGPAFTATIITLANFIIFNINYKEINLNKEYSLHDAKSILKSSNVISVTLCNILWFTLLFNFSFYETILSPLAKAEFAWSDQQAILYLGILLFSDAVLSSTTYVSTKILTKRFKERHLLAFSLLCLSLCYLIVLPISDEYPKLAQTNGTSTTSTPSTTSMSFSNNVNVIENNVAEREATFSAVLDNKNYSEETIGCNPVQYSWCTDQHKVLLVQLVTSQVLLSLTYPMGIITTTSLYSQSIENSQSQGVFQGILTATGSLSRALGPVFVSGVFEKRGPLTVFPSISGMTFFIFLLVIIFNKKFGKS